MILDLEETFTVGEESFFDSVSPKDSYGVVFEDNTVTGYFYALDLKDGQKILDALHIYDVENVIDKNILSKIQIAWTENGAIASLLINNYCHAIFDFESQAGYCRNGFPKPKTEWSHEENRTLTDDLIDRIIK